MDIKFTGELTRFDIEPSDRFVLTTDETLTREQQDNIQSAWRGFARERYTGPLLILDNGAKLLQISQSVAIEIDTSKNTAERLAEVTKP